MSDIEITRSQINLYLSNEKALLPQFQELCVLVAKKQRIYYSSLIKQGFNKEEAMGLLLDSDLSVELTGIDNISEEDA